MPQALVPVLVSIGLSTVAAQVVAYVAVAVATSFVSGLLRGGAPKPDAAERTVKSSAPARIYILGKRRSHGAIMLFINTSESETVDVWAYAEGPVHAVIGAYLNDDVVTISSGTVSALADGSYDDGKVLAGYNLGASPEISHAAVVTRVPEWTSDHRGDGICSGYLIKQAVKSSDFLEIYPQGDNVEMSLVIEGLACHDPREAGSDPYDPSTWAYTENPALHLLWLYTTYQAEDYATTIAPVEAMWIAAADDCDVEMTLATGGTEPKYRAWVMFTADTEPQDIEAEIKGTFDGWTSRDENGCIRVYSGNVYTPTLSIGAAHIIDYEVQDFVEIENSVNEIIVRHISEPHDFNTVEPQAWRNDDAILDAGKVISTGLELQVPSHTQARRLAKRLEARTNAAKRGRVKVVFSAREVLLERFVYLHIEEADAVFFNGVAEVLGGERDGDTGGAVIEWVAVDANIDSWNPATEDGEPAPVTTKTYLAPLEAPMIISATADFSDIGSTSGEAGSSVSGVRILIAANGPVRDDLTWYARWRLGTGVWSERSYPDADPGPGVSLVTEYVPYGTTVTVEVAYGTGDGRVSPWSASEDVDTTP